MMRFIDWLIAGSLVLVGLSCLTVSGTFLSDSGSISSYVKTFLQICIWGSIPVFILVIIYFILRKKRRENK